MGTMLTLTLHLKSGDTSRRLEYSHLCRNRQVLPHCWAILSLHRDKIHTGTEEYSKDPWSSLLGMLSRSCKELPEHLPSTKSGHLDQLIQLDVIVNSSKCNPHSLHRKLLGPSKSCIQLYSKMTLVPINQFLDLEVTYCWTLHTSSIELTLCWCVNDVPRSTLACTLYISFI